MLPNRVSNPESVALESDAIPTELRGPAGIMFRLTPRPTRGGRVVRGCWVNFQCRGVLLIWIIVGRGPVALAVGAGGGCLDIFSLTCPFSPLSPSLWETA